LEILIASGRRLRTELSVTVSPVRGLTLGGKLSGPKTFFGVGVGVTVGARVGVKVRVGVTVGVRMGVAMSVSVGSGVMVTAGGGRVITKVGGASNPLLHEAIKKGINITRKNLGMVGHISLTDNVYTGIISKLHYKRWSRKHNATPRQPARF
jgi:hypothetical protein